jgi:excisionase family DNA binding protein
MERQTLSVPEFAEAVGISRNGGYEAVHRGDVRSIRIGQRLLIPRSEVERLLNSASVPSKPARSEETKSDSSSAA